MTIQKDFEVKIRQVMAVLSNGTAYTLEMKRFFRHYGLRLLLLMALSGGLCPTLGLYPAEAATGRGSLKLQSFNFYYRLDEATRYLELKTQWQSEHRGEVSISEAIHLAMEAHQASDMDAPFTRWRYQGGPSPAIFGAKAHVYTTGQKAMLNVHFLVTMRAKVGNWRVNPTLQLTDFEGLARSAHWEQVSQQTFTIPAIAAGEDVMLTLSEFQLYRFLQKHPNQFPVELEVRLSNPLLGTVITTLPMRPDHFMTPQY